MDDPKLYQPVRTSRGRRHLFAKTALAGVRGVGRRVLECSNAKDTVSHCRSGDFSLVCVEMNMPGRAWFSLLSELHLACSP